jgi:opacity protein-like surface antigen
MRRVLAIGFSLFLSAAAASAQVPTSGNVFVGYSYYNTNIASSSRSNLNGWEASLEGKALPGVGIVADFSGHYGSQDVPSGVATCAIGVTCSPLHASLHETNVLFGPRVGVSVGKIRPFAEALFGAGHVSSNGGGSDTSFATALGGGLDYKIIKPVALRFEGDYVQTRFFGSTQNNVRISTGIVLRF